MSNKRRKFSSEFKVKLVLEVLKNEKPLNQIAQENNILPKNILNWKKQFLENAEIAMEPSKAVKEYKDQIKDLEKKVDRYAKTVGKLTVERDWAVGKQNPPQKAYALLGTPSRAWTYRLKERW